MDGDVDDDNEDDDDDDDRFRHNNPLSNDNEQGNTKQTPTQLQ